MPKPHRRRGEEARASNEGCVTCHATIAREWRGSHHQRATTNPAYEAALAIEPSAFCRGCHAPEAPPGAATPSALRELGVGCVTCHVTEEGTVLAAPLAEKTPGTHAPDPMRDESTTPAHVIVRSTRFASPAACAGCHEFRFPSSGGDEDAHMMQTTIREHAASPAADLPCATCHLPSREGHRAHDFANVRDPAFLRQNVLATAVRTEDGATITLRQARPAHAFPTGDLFRRLAIRAQLVRADGHVVLSAERHLARHLVFLPGHRDRVLTDDDRLFAEPVDVALSWPRPLTDDERATLFVRWAVTYQRPATVGIGTDPSTARIESEVLLQRGQLGALDREKTKAP